MPFVPCSANHKESKPPRAVRCCLSCSAYFCSACDSSVHAPKSPLASHYRFHVENLKSYIVFNGAKQEGESHIRRNFEARDGPKFATIDGAQTLYEAFHRACGSYSSRPAFGHRVLSSNGAVGPYSYTDYKTFQQKVNNVGNALANQGLSQNARIALYSANRAEWSIAEFASYNFNLIPVPLYDTLGPEAADFIISQARVEVVFSSFDKLESLKSIANKHTHLKTIVIMPALPYEKQPAQPLVSSPSVGAGVSVWTFNDFLQFGASKPKLPHTPPNKEDVATICYTSGTTGVPKGAVLTHGGMISNLGSVEAQGLKITSSDSHISYLPLAHMFERLVLAMNYFKGAQVSFSRGSPLLLLEDIEVAKPTVFVGVPRLYNRLYDKVLATIDEGGAIKKWLFDTAYKSKVHNLKNNNVLTSTIWDKIIFSKIAAKLGGRVRLMVTGSAPIADNVMTFLRVCFSATVMEGYGQTEACAAVTTTLPHVHGLGNVGIPVSCNEIKLVDVPDMNYRSTDVVNGVPQPRGEICVRGGNVFKGYYLDKEKTAEAIDKDGFLHSGDIGMWLPDGTLKIIDRKKNIFKLSQGEYIAPEKCENVYAQSKYVAQVFVYGDSLQSCLVGIVVPDEEILTAWAKKNNVAGSFSALIALPAVKSLIFGDMTAVGTSNGLASFEQVKDITLSHQLWTPENDMLTPTMKLKRNKVQSIFQSSIDAMYRSLASSNSDKNALEQRNSAQIKSKL